VINLLVLYKYAVVWEFILVEVHVGMAIESNLTDVVQRDRTVDGISACDCGEGGVTEATALNGGITDILRDFGVAAITVGAAMLEITERVGVLVIVLVGFVN
jgi:hypothetical protein